MSVAVLKDKYNAMLYCSTTMKSVSNVFADPDRAEGFLEQFDGDPRHYSAYEIDCMFFAWLERERDHDSE